MQVLNDSRWLTSAMVFFLVFSFFATPCPATFGQSVDDSAVPSAEESPEVTETVSDDSKALNSTSTSTSSETVDGAEPVAELSLAKNAWMLTCCALVLFMTAPGLAMFYGGLVRKKNVIGVVMQCFFLMGLMTCLWFTIGYSLAFGGDNPYWGNLDYTFLNGVVRYWDADLQMPVTPMSGDLPEMTVMLFQGMFFIITPALICGAFAERMKFSAMVIFSAIWGLLVYCPVCHWVWDGGILAYGEDAALGGGALDFAGGTVVHISSGVTALLCALFIGNRSGFGTSPMPPHNLTYTAFGAAMLWFGWFGFNAGSGLSPDGLGTSAFAATHVSAAAGAVAWGVMEWIVHRKPTLLGTCSGAVAGLVTITPAAGFVNIMPAIVMGAVGGLVCFWACTSLKNKLGYDDSLDAFGVHGVGGIVGAVLTGVFATRAVNDVNSGNPVGLVDGAPGLVMAQVIAVIVTIVYALVISYILLLLLDKLLGGIRVPMNTEQIGLDIAEHGEEGYIFL